MFYTMPIISLFLAMAQPATLPSTQPTTFPDAVLDATPVLEIAVTVDTTKAPDVELWAQEARQLCQQWWQQLNTMLPSEGNVPAKAITLFFENYDGVAETADGRIRINAEWIRKHPDDRGMVIHELVHVVQQYPDGSPGWLTEGIADYIRYYKFEPNKPRGKLNRETASYTQGYGVAAGFLDWIVTHKDEQAVVKLNAVLRKRKLSDEEAKQIVGSDWDTLWAEYVNSLPGPKIAAKVPATRPAE